MQDHLKSIFLQAQSRLHLYRFEIQLPQRLPNLYIKYCNILETKSHTKAYALISGDKNVGALQQIEQFQ
jgi:hypothetical protein